MLRDELLAEHWSYMGRYAAQMIARGPTLAAVAINLTPQVLPDPTHERIVIHERASPAL